MNISHSAIRECRICGSDGLTEVLDLGVQALTGVFPRADEPDPPAGPLRLLTCGQCGLVQLAHNYELPVLYGQNYGYRSGLNGSMVRHLGRRVRAIEALVGLKAGDVVLDIGSNDGTLLAQYETADLSRIGIDPTAAKFRSFYSPDVTVIEDFFSAEAFHAAGAKTAKIVTSISMFYDLEEPSQFVAQVAGILDADGVWVFEQSYLPSMLQTRSYDTVCHEHLEYYGLAQILRLLRVNNLKIVDLEFNNVNGGSFCVTAARRDARYPEAESALVAALASENAMALDTRAPFDRLRLEMERHREQLVESLELARTEGLFVRGYGASTKGNVLLQYCGLNADLVPEIVEVNEDKFGAVTPGTRIPIVAEDDALRAQTDVFLVLPWHFREGIVAKESEFMKAGGALLFPLPEVEIVTAGGIRSPKEMLATCQTRSSTGSR